MPYCVPPIVNSWSKNGAFPNTKPARVVKPITNLRGLDPGRSPPSWPSGAYQRPSRSRRWKSPVPPRIPPLWEMPIWCIVPAVGDGRGGRGGRGGWKNGRGGGRGRGEVSGGGGLFKKKKRESRIAASMTKQVMAGRLAAYAKHSQYAVLPSILPTTKIRVVMRAPHRGTQTPGS